MADRTEYDALINDYLDNKLTVLSHVRGNIKKMIT